MLESGEISMTILPRSIRMEYGGRERIKASIFLQFFFVEGQRWRVGRFEVVC